MAGRTAPAQEYVGGTKCFNCHKLGRKAWQESHAQTLAQLSEPKAAEYAKATGGDAKHPKCLACHAPVTVAGAPAAVSCESCHGPAKGWITPHQEPAFYAAPPAQWMGLRNLHKNSKEIARICVECHVVNDKAIAAAGHPVGASFDAGRDLASPKMVHWPSGTTGDARVRTYDRAFYAAVTRDGAPLVASRSAGLGPAKAAGGAPPKPAAAVAGSAARAAAPAVNPKPGAPAAASSDEYADLGDDEFVQGGSAPSAAAAPAIASAPAPPRPKPRPIERLALPDAPSGAFEQAPVRIERQPVAAKVPSAPAVTAARAAAAPGAPPAAPPAATVATPPAVASAKPRNIAEARGRAALVLADLIRQKKKLDLPPPAPPAEFAGPDGELLRLQDEVMALALETLRKEP
jgi:hypothetical protein